MYIDKYSSYNSINNLPNSITHLTFDYEFNQPLDNLPNSVIHLIFGIFLPTRKSFT